MLRFLIFAVLFYASLNISSGRIVHKYVENGVTKVETIHQRDRREVFKCKQLFNAINKSNTRYYELGRLTNATGSVFGFRMKSIYVQIKLEISRLNNKTKILITLLLQVKLSNRATKHASHPLLQVMESAVEPTTFTTMNRYHHLREWPLMLGS